MTKTRKSLTMIKLAWTMRCVWLCLSQSEVYFSVFNLDFERFIILTDGIRGWFYVSRQGETTNYWVCFGKCPDLESKATEGDREERKIKWVVETLFISVNPKIAQAINNYPHSLILNILGKILLCRLVYNLCMLCQYYFAVNES